MCALHQGASGGSGVFVSESAVLLAPHSLILADLPLRLLLSLDHGRRVSDFMRRWCRYTF